MTGNETGGMDFITGNQNAFWYGFNKKALTVYMNPTPNEFCFSLMNPCVTFSRNIWLQKQILLIKGINTLAESPENHVNWVPLSPMERATSESCSTANKKTLATAPWPLPLQVVYAHRIKYTCDLLEGTRKTDACAPVISGLLILSQGRRFMNTDWYLHWRSPRAV